MVVRVVGTLSPYFPGLLTICQNIHRTLLLDIELDDSKVEIIVPFESYVYAYFVLFLQLPLMITVSVSDPGPIHIDGVSSRENISSLRRSHRE